jgi:hypothetical protein
MARRSGRPGRLARAEDAWPALGAALAAFIREHEYCGELDTGLKDDLFWMTCTCRARLERDADRD